jgi:hypothetical protein
VTRPPDFGDLLGDDELSPDEEERLRRIHELLVTAGPPAELPPRLTRAPPERAAPVLELPALPRRRLGATLILAAALAAALFGGGYWVGTATHSFTTEATIPMRGASPSQFASIQLAPADKAFNWPLLLRVRGLQDLPKGGYYELVLTRNGKLGLSCGTFRTHDGKTEIVLNAPYPLKGAGWAIIAHYPDHSQSGPILTTADA